MYPPIHVPSFYFDADYLPNQRHEPKHKPKTQRLRHFEGFLVCVFLRNSVHDVPQIARKSFTVVGFRSFSGAERCVCGVTQQNAALLSQLLSCVTGNEWVKILYGNTLLQYLVAKWTE